MKMFFIGLILSVCSLNARNLLSPDTKITLKKSSAAPEQIIDEIEKNAHHSSVYTKDVDMKSSTSRKTLNSLFSGTDIHYDVEDSHIVFSSRKKAPEEGSGISIAQQDTKRITGTITDENGEPLPDVNISVKGTVTGVISDVDGNYVILASGEDRVLVFSYIGFATQEIAVGDRKVIDVSMHENAIDISEVVVTALGIKREEKALGYAVQTVKGEALTTVKGVELGSQLTGKIAGVTVYNGSDFANEPSIQIRGESPLIVIDGIPFPNMSLRDISQDDIESISVLKGSTASALYGSRGGSGALMISTKRGEQDGVKVSFSSSDMFSAGYATMIHNQTSYSSGIGGRYDPEDYVWGDKLDIGRTAVQYDPFTYEWREMPLVSRGKDNFKSFIETAVVTNNNVNIAYKGKNGSFRTSFTHVYNKGQYPNNYSNRFNYSIAGDLKLGKLELDASATIGKWIVPQTYGEGYGLTGAIYTILLWSGAEYDLRDFRDYWQKGKEDVQQNWWSPVWYTNPWFTMYEVTRSQDRSVFSGQTHLTYELLPWLKIAGRVGIDGYDRRFEEKTPLSTLRKAPLGEFYQYMDRGWALNGEALLMADKKIGDFSIDGFLGTSVYYNQSTSFEGRTAGGLSIPGFFSLKASVEPIAFGTGAYGIQNNSVFGEASFAWKSTAFVEVTGRNDWVSTLSENERSFFYPSVSGSLVLTELLPEIRHLNFWKVRGSWTQTKMPAGVYSINTTYGINISNMYKGMTGAVYPSLSRSGSLTPATREEWEIGTEARVLDSRLRADIAYFHRLYYNNQREATLSKASGFERMQVNWDEEYLRKGVEITLSGDVIRNRDWVWTPSVNWGRMRYVYNRIDPVYSQKFYWVAEGELVNWEQRTDIEKSPDGQFVHRADGLLKRTTVDSRFYKDPDWVWGFSNTLKWKNFSLLLSFDGRVGGQNDNDSDWDMWRTGSHPDSDNQWRYDEVVNGLHNYVGKGVKIVDGTIQYDYDGRVLSDTRVFAPNDIETSYEQYIRAMYGSGPVSTSVFDLTFLKLREAAIGYNLPQTLARKLHLDNLQLSLIGQNLYIWVKEFRWADPDKGRDDENAPLPRYVGLNIKVDF
ncbi:MAG: SusC/RagA family TonB-linked outer membrane protein [Tannerella sp.]|nr:SusC/RagA family TonB-linked outer membrane protein [Tannerella sp.]